MNWKKLALVALPILTLVLGMPGWAVADLVQNGGFETNSGPYQLGYDGQTVPSRTSSGYTFIFDSSGTSDGNAGSVSLAQSPAPYAGNS